MNQPFPICLEYNFHGGNGTDDRPVGPGCANAIFFDVAGKKNTTTCIRPQVARTFHGDQWVIAELDVKYGQITHYVNGEAILSYADPTYCPRNKTAKELMENGGASVKSGHLSFESNSHPIDFRKIELMAY